MSVHLCAFVLDFLTKNCIHCNCSSLLLVSPRPCFSRQYQISCSTVINVPPLEIYCHPCEYQITISSDQHRTVNYHPQNVPLWKHTNWPLWGIFFLFSFFFFADGSQRLVILPVSKDSFSSPSTNLVFIAYLKLHTLYSLPVFSPQNAVHLALTLVMRPSLARYVSENAVISMSYLLNASAKRGILISGLFPLPHSSKVWLFQQTTFNLMPSMYLHFIF